MRGLWLGAILIIALGLGYCFGILAERDKLEDARFDLRQLQLRNDYQLSRQLPPVDSLGYPRGPR